MKVINKDAAMTALRCKLREAREQKNRSMEAITNACLTIIGGLPEQDVAEGISCGECFFYDRTAKRCIHKNGLGGRVRPGMYCSYGSASATDEGLDIEPDDEKWSEFDDQAI